ncbi:MULTISPECIES: hypothetical protein [Colwellia]|uniref:Uncharacterized protein n=1 Tax=Colwellia marinimaniae TaxID=1513592 RepID=A0ABQ0MUS9_9GAMM|nr:MULTISPECIES: hypothetical protein [Colwellia]GAW96115.1 hypothetical protein MTCD1_01725 [Colwellia marinimaniae]
MKPAINLADLKYKYYTLNLDTGMTFIIDNFIISYAYHELDNYYQYFYSSHTIEQSCNSERAKGLF